ncbi:cation:proton antiporter [Acidobacteria bacterium AH-259-G07]|nr:cation:proton antiporter [Acidobacteria bacterium AH-259-G07]
MEHLLQVLLILVGIIVAAKVAGAISVRYGQPAVFGEIAIGLILGPTVLNVLDWNLFSHTASHGAGALNTLLGAADQSDSLNVSAHSLYLKGLIQDLAEIGVILLMFVAGMETDLEGMKKVGKIAFWAAMGGILLPFFGGASVSVYFGYPLYWEAIFVGTILTATSVSISAQTLMELRVLRSREGTTILGAAVIDDVLGIILLGAVTALSAVGIAEQAEAAGIGTVILIILKMSLYFLVFWFVGRRYLERWCEVIRNFPASQALLAFVLVIAFSYAWAAEYFAHLAAITGSYMAGVLFAQTRFKEEINSHIHPLTYSLFVPIFFVSIGLRANGRELGGEIDFLIIIVLLAIVTKMLGCFVGARVTGFDNLESLRVGMGMVSRGEVGLIIANVGLGRGIIAQDIFSVMVIMVLVTTMITPIMLRYAFPPVHEAYGEVFESIGQVEDKKSEDEARRERQT